MEITENEEKRDVNIKLNEEFLLDDESFKYWKSLPRILKKEAALLLIGINPEKMDVPPENKEGLYQNYTRAYRAISRAVDSGSLKENFNLRDAVGVIKRERINVYLDERVSSLKKARSYRKKYEYAIKECDKLRSEVAKITDLNGTEIKSIYGLLLGIAVAGYKYTGKQDKTVIEMDVDLKYLGIPQPSEATIQKTLMKAYEYLSNLDGYQAISNRKIFEMNVK